MQIKKWVYFVVSLKAMVFFALAMGWVYSDLSAQRPLAVLFLVLGTGCAVGASIFLEELTEKGEILPFGVFFLSLTTYLFLALYFQKEPPFKLENIRVEHAQNLAMTIYLLSVFILAVVLLVDRIMDDQNAPQKPKKIRALHSFFSLVVCAGVFSLLGWKGAMSYQKDVTTIWGWNNARAEVISAYETGRKNEKELFESLQDLDKKREELKYLFFADELVPQTAFVQAKDWCAMMQKHYQEPKLFNLCTERSYNPYKNLTKQEDYVPVYHKTLAQM